MKPPAFSATGKAILLPLHCMWDGVCNAILSPRLADVCTPIPIPSANDRHPLPCPGARRWRKTHAVQFSSVCTATGINHQRSTELISGQIQGTDRKSSSFLGQRKLFFRPVPQGGPAGWLHVKKSSSRWRVSVFFNGKPCRRPPKNKLKEAQEIRMPAHAGDV